VEALVANHMRFKDAGRMKQSSLKRFLRLPRFEEHLELHRLDALGSNGHLDNYNLVKRKLEEFPEECLKPERLLTGADLMVAGYGPGPQFSRILAAGPIFWCALKLLKTHGLFFKSRKDWPVNQRSAFSDRLPICDKFAGWASWMSFSEPEVPEVQRLRADR
jgi:hypothetical protein